MEKQNYVSVSEKISLIHSYHLSKKDEAVVQCPRISFKPLLYGFKYYRVFGCKILSLTDDSSDEEIRPKFRNIFLDSRNRNMFT